ncbi:MAG: DUF5123 domain-containing protein [Prevotella sp.]|nr:DUF5123 domain-containing protein [Prevotella sp.]
MRKKFLQNKFVSLLAMFLILFGGVAWASYANAVSPVAEGEVDPAPDPTPTPSSPVVISPENGADIATVLETAKAAVDKVGDITINLAKGGAYTISKTLEAPASIVINGNGATVDASANAATLILLTDGNTVEGSDYKRIDNVKIDGVTFKGVKNSLLYDNNVKLCVVDLTINNSVFDLQTEAVENEALISFKNGGAKDVNITNSTFYGNNAFAKYFIRYNNSARLDRYGFDKNTEFQTMNYQNNTFYGLLKSDGQWGNYSAIQGQNYIKFDVKNNIWYNCGKEIIRRMAGGRFGSNAPQEFANNTYFNDGADQSASEASYDKSGTILITNPTFADAANADFHVFVGSQQAKMQTGDTRWAVTYDASQALPVPVVLSPATDTDIATALDEAKAAVDKVGDITINLAENGAYTISKTLEAPAGIVINGNGATIDASALEAPFITMSANPSAELINNFNRVGSVKIANVKVNGLKNSIFYDNNKPYCVVDFTIDNSVLALATEAVQNEALISFKAGGAKDFTIKNSTVYGNGAVAKYFIRYNNNGRIDRYGYTESTDTWSMTYTNNTFYNLLKSADGQWGNYGGVASKAKQMVMTVKDNIWMDCTSQVMRRLAQGKSFKDFNSASSMSNNTFWNTMTNSTDKQDNYGNGTDLITNPTFADAANGDFTIGASTQQAKFKTGDPRWLTNEYVAPTIDKTALETEIATATTLLGDASIEDGTAGATLMAAINAAQTILDNAEFQEEIDAAVNTLQAAEEAYKATGINDITTGAADNGAWYNMQGVKVEKPTQRGVYIHNGKKIVVR